MMELNTPAASNTDLTLPKSNPGRAHGLKSTLLEGGYKNLVLLEEEEEYETEGERDLKWWVLGLNGNSK